jgi:hypothetical protein
MKIEKQTLADLNEFFDMFDCAFLNNSGAVVFERVTVIPVIGQVTISFNPSNRTVMLIKAGESIWSGETGIVHSFDSLRRIVCSAFADSVAYEMGGLL